MSLLNSFVNQIGREMGRDAYRSVKKSVTSSVKSPIGVSLNQSHLDSIRGFTVSPYDKVTHRNFRNLTNKILEGVDPKCFLFDDVYMEYVSLAEDLQKTIGSDQFNFLDEETDSLISSRMKADVKKHIDWLKSLRVVFENDLEDNSKILNYFYKFVNIHCLCKFNNIITLHRMVLGLRYFKRYSIIQLQVLQ
jgi:hypothetical protein